MQNEATPVPAGGRAGRGRTRGDGLGGRPRGATSLRARGGSGARAAVTGAGIMAGAGAVQPPTGLRTSRRLTRGHVNLAATEQGRRLWGVFSQGFSDAWMQPEGARLGLISESRMKTEGVGSVETARGVTHTAGQFPRRESGEMRLRRAG